MSHEAEIIRVRAWTGDEPSDALVTDALDRCGSVEAAALEILSTRRANMEADPLKWAIDGDLSEDWTENAARLDARIASLDQLLGSQTLPSLTAGQLTRPDRERI